MVEAKPRSSRVFISIPANWDTMTAEQKHAAALAMAEAFQRALRGQDMKQASARGRTGP